MELYLRANDLFIDHSDVSSPFPSGIQDQLLLPFCCFLQRLLGIIEVELYLRANDIFIDHSDVISLLGTQDQLVSPSCCFLQRPLRIGEFLEGADACAVLSCRHVTTVLEEESSCLVGSSLDVYVQADDKEAAVVYSSRLELELSTVEPCLSGPKR